MANMYWTQAFLETELSKTGQYNDLLQEYLIGLGFDVGTLNDNLAAFLADQGYTGTISDNWKQYEATI